MEPVFTTLMNDFIETIPDFELNEESTLKFASYHQERAKLRYLCKTCNGTESTKRGRKKTQTAEEKQAWLKQYHQKRHIERYKPTARISVY
jgi:hypothetical protein